MRIILNFILFTIYTLNNSFICFKCKSDENSIELSITNIKDKSDIGKFLNSEQSENKRSLQKHTVSNTYDFIRIHFDYSNIESNHLIDEGWLNSLKKVMFEAQIIFESIIKVKNIKSNLTTTMCGVNNLKIPDYIKNEGVPADIIIFVIIDETMNDNVEAWATPCAISNIDNRPLAGVVSVSTKSIKFEKENYMLYYTYLMIHEITHVLVMSPVLYSLFWNKDLYIKRDISEVVIENILINGVKRQLIKTPKVVEAAKRHFACDSLIGIELENQGSQGSIGGHWESRIMLGDIMNAASYEDIALSDITLALFEDSGWYNVEYYTGGLFKFGKDAGCDFLNEKCISNKKRTSKYFCDKGDENSCYSGNKYKGACDITSGNDIKEENYNYFNSLKVGGFKYADYCPIPRSYYYKNYFYGGNCTIGKPNSLPSIMNEVISSNSGCFVASLVESERSKINKQAVCYEYECDNINQSVIVKVKENKILCRYENEIVTIPGYTGELTCPSYKDYCSSTVRCNDIKDCIIKKSKLKDIHNKKIEVNDISEIKKDTTSNSSTKSEKTKTNSETTNIQTSKNKNTDTDTYTDTDTDNNIENNNYDILKTDLEIDTSNKYEDDKSILSSHSKYMYINLVYIFIIVYMYI